MSLPEASAPLVPPGPDMKRTQPLMERKQTSALAQAGDAAEAGDTGAQVAAEVTGKLGKGRMLTAAEVALVLRIAKKTVYRMIETGRLTAVDVTASAAKRHIRVWEADLTDFIGGAVIAPGTLGDIPDDEE